MNRITLAGTVALVVVALTACVAGGPTAKPTAVVVLPDAPEARVPLTCDDFLDIVAETLREPADALTLEPAYAVTSASVAGAQAGLLRCSWITSDQFVRPYMQLSVLPDAASLFEERQRFGSPAAAYDVLGEGSQVDCTWNVEDDAHCTASFLVNGYWADFTILPGSTAVVDLPSAQALGLAAGESISALIAAAGPPAPAFVPQPGAAGWDLCGVLGFGPGFRDSIKSPSLDVLYDGIVGVAGGVTYASLYAGHMKSCVWTREDFATVPDGEVRQVSVQVVVGGSWAWPEFVAMLDSTEAQRVEIRGADEAFISCSGQGSCVAYALVQGSYVSANLSYAEETDVDARSTTIAALEFLIPRM